VAGEQIGTYVCARVLQVTGTSLAAMALPENFRYKVEPLETAEYRDSGALQGELNRQAMLGWEFVGTVTLDVDNGAGPREQLVYRRSDRQ
jgi:hypothetical protein